MYKRFRKNKPDNSSQPPQTDSLSDSLEHNEALFHELFKNDDIIVYRHFENQNNTFMKCCAIFVDGMVNHATINDNIIWPIINNSCLKKSKYPLDVLQTQVIMAHDIKKTADLKKLIEALNTGNTILLVDGAAEALIISSQGWQTRAITEPESEKVLRGPKEGSTESLMMNLSMVRRKLNTYHQLKFKFKVLGSRVYTKACSCYIEGLASQAILDELEKRLNEINLDGILGTGYIAEFIKDAPFSPFKTIGSTERLDAVAGKLLEGRIALILDGSPVVLTLPHIFIEYFQANDDYYLNFFFSSISRIIRIVSFIFSTSIPSIYIALTTFHQEMLPTPLLLSISASRQGVAFPTIIELLIERLNPQLSWGE